MWRFGGETGGLIGTGSDSAAGRREEKRGVAG